MAIKFRLIEGGQAYFEALVICLGTGTLSGAQLRPIFLISMVLHCTGGRGAWSVQLCAVCVSGWWSMAWAHWHGLPPAWRERFAAGRGAVLRIYSPLGTLGLLIPSRWRRLHRKLCVIDGHLAFCGGINILDDLVRPAPRHRCSTAAAGFCGVRGGPWCKQMQETMTQLWWRIEGVATCPSAAISRRRSALFGRRGCICAVGAADRNPPQAWPQPRGQGGLAAA
jgi:cardiolipin synthase A/B